MVPSRAIRAYFLAAALWAAGLVSAVPGACLAQDPAARFALVIGNSRYEGGTWAPLRNPHNDATAIAAALRTLRFQIVGCGTAGVCFDATRSTMDSAIHTFLRKLEDHPGAIAFVYYSGHAVQARRAPDRPDENFLVPVRSGIEDEFDLVPKAVSLQDLLDEMTQVDVYARVLVLDACRNDGLRRPEKSANIRGLASVARRGFLIAYAAEPGQVALDTIPGSNIRMSPYARRLSEQLLLPKSITDVFLDAGTEVSADTRDEQNPEAVIELTHNLYLAGRGPAEGPTSAVAQTLHTQAPEPTRLRPPGPPAEKLTTADMAARGRDYEDGTGGLRRDYTEAVRWYSRAAQAGDAAAQGHLGLMYARGVGGLHQDEVEAVHWYTLGAAQGDADADYFLGEMYARGAGGLAQDDARALNWYTQAAERGNSDAAAALGEMYARGRGAAKSPGEADRWLSRAVRQYRKAADQGDARGETGLALCYLQGWGGLAKDETEAAHWLTRAAAQGQPQAETLLGSLYIRGRGGLYKSDTEAVSWFRKAAGQGYLGGEAALGEMYLNGRGGLTQNVYEGERWLTRAAEQGLATAQSDLGNLYLRGRYGIAEDDARAARLYTQAARQGNALAQAVVGYLYMNGRGLPQDDVKAVRWSRRAADQGNPIGENNLGVLYENGRGGLPRDEPEAIRLFQLAARNGNTVAQENLTKKGLTWDNASEAGTLAAQTPPPPPPSSEDYYSPQQPPPPPYPQTAGSQGYDVRGVIGGVLAVQQPSNVGGYYVDRVAAPEYRAGLRPGDVVISVNGAPVSRAATWRGARGPVRLLVRRGRRQMFVRMRGR